MASPSPVPPTFISSLDIVFSDDEGSSGSPASTRLAKSSSAQGQLGAGNSSTKERMTTGAVSRMNVRASKATALAAMAAKAAAAAAQSEPAPPSPAAAAPPVVKKEEILGAHPSKNPYRQQFNPPRAPPLDYSTLRMEAPRLPTRRRATSRACSSSRRRPSTSRPSRSLRTQWNTSSASRPRRASTASARSSRLKDGARLLPSTARCVRAAALLRLARALTNLVRPQTFRFKTRLQQLNSMEASARASLNFLEQLYLFHRQQGSSGMTLPAIGGKPVDMWRLKREVSDLGGYHAVRPFPPAFAATRALYPDSLPLAVR